MGCLPVCAAFQVRQRGQSQVQQLAVLPCEWVSGEFGAGQCSAAGSRMQGSAGNGSSAGSTAQGFLQPLLLLRACRPACKSTPSTWLASWKNRQAVQGQQQQEEQQKQRQPAEVVKQRPPLRWRHRRLRASRHSSRRSRLSSERHHRVSS